MPRKGNLFVFFGMIAGGKSVLGKAWAKRHGMHYYNSDVVRKELAGLAPAANRKESLNQGIYSKESTKKTYDALLQHAEHDLSTHVSVVLDASYQNKAERDRIITLARNDEVQVYFVYCACSEAETKKRLAVRAKDPKAVSDGRWEIYRAQKERFEPPEEIPPEQLIRIFTEAPVEELLESLENKVRTMP